MEATNSANATSPPDINPVQTEQPANLSGLQPVRTGNTTAATSSRAGQIDSAEQQAASTSSAQTDQAAPASQSIADTNQYRPVGVSLRSYLQQHHNLSRQQAKDLLLSLKDHWEYMGINKMQYFRISLDTLFVEEGKLKLGDISHISAEDIYSPSRKDFFHAIEKSIYTAQSSQTCIRVSPYNPYPDALTDSSNTFYYTIHNKFCYAKAKAQKYHQSGTAEFYWLFDQTLFDDGEIGGDILAAKGKRFSDRWEHEFYHMVTDAYYYKLECEALSGTNEDWENIGMAFGEILNNLAHPFSFAVPKTQDECLAIYLRL